MKLTRNLGRAVAGTACSVALVAAGASASTAVTTDGSATTGTTAAAARPLLKVPFPCNQTWRGTTWQGHNPDRAIDLNFGGGNDDLGKTVKASGPGTVVAAGNVGSGYGNRVIVSHGNGWQTLYAHLNSIGVKNGQAVTASTTIGQVGKSGGQPTSHLHYEQRLNGSPVSIKFGSATYVKYYATAYFTRTNGC